MTTACCLCCVAAAERNELDHLVSNECPLGGCDYHHPLTPSAVGAARERLYASTASTAGKMPPRPAFGSTGPCLCEHERHKRGESPHSHPYGAERPLTYWSRTLGTAVCGPCGLATMVFLPGEVEKL